MLKYFFEKKNKRSGENKRETEDNPWVLEQIIEESLLGYCMSSVIGECFVCFDDAIATIYQGTYFKSLALYGIILHFIGLGCIFKSQLDASFSPFMVSFQIKSRYRWIFIEKE